MRVGVAHHFGWAVAVTSAADHRVVDRRRIELVEPGITAAPIHYESSRLDVAATAALVERARASVVRATAAALDELANQVSIATVSLTAAVQASLADLRAAKGSVLVTNGGLGFMEQSITDMAAKYGMMGLSVANAAKRKLVALLAAKLTSSRDNSPFATELASSACLPPSVTFIVHVVHPIVCPGVRCATSVVPPSAT